VRTNSHHGLGQVLPSSEPNLAVRTGDFHSAIEYDLPLCPASVLRGGSAAFVSEPPSSHAWQARPHTYPRPGGRPRALGPGTGGIRALCRTERGTERGRRVCKRRLRLSIRIATLVTQRPRAGRFDGARHSAQRSLYEVPRSLSRGPPRSLWHHHEDRTTTDTRAWRTEDCRQCGEE